MLHANQMSLFAHNVITERLQVGSASLWAADADRPAVLAAACKLCCGWAVAVGVAVGISACGLVPGYEPCNDSPAAAYAVDLPPSAEDFVQRCEGNVHDEAYTATFTMLPNDLQLFHDTNYVSGWVTDASTTRAFSEEAERMSSLLASRFDDGVIEVEVLIDTSSTRRYRVFYHGRYDR